MTYYCFVRIYKESKRGFEKKYIHCNTPNNPTLAINIFFYLIARQLNRLFAVNVNLTNPFGLLISPNCITLKSLTLPCVRLFFAPT